MKTFKIRHQSRKNELEEAAVDIDNFRIKTSGSLASSHIINVLSSLGYEGCTYEIEGKAKGKIPAPNAANSTSQIAPIINNKSYKKHALMLRVVDGNTHVYKEDEFLCTLPEDNTEHDTYIKAALLRSALIEDDVWEDVKHDLQDAI